jgi:hypothetical protein
LADGNTYKSYSVPSVTPAEMVSAYLSGELLIDSALLCWETWWNAASSVRLKSYASNMSTLLWSMVTRITEMMTVRLSSKVTAEYGRFMDSMMIWTLPINVHYITPFMIKLAENIFTRLFQRNEHLDHVALFLVVAESKLCAFSGRKVCDGVCFSDSID